MNKELPNPEHIDGVPTCSRYKCPLFKTYTQSGWGVHEQCSLWDTKQHGSSSYSLMSPTLCHPYVSMVLNRLREES